MIGNIVRLLQTDEWQNVSPEVEIAKGQYEYISTWRKFIKQAKRMLK